MLHEGRPVPLSPSKGKAREETRWRTGWWDFTPLLEHTQKPLAWSEASILFFAHPTRLDVIGRHFSSSKQFLISPPPLVNSSSSQFNPPSFISIAPGDGYLFVFYPGKTGNSVGCIWKRGPRIDSWLIVDCWEFAKFTYPVAAEWLGSPRTWHLDATGSASRLPLRGPQTPVSDPNLLYITSDHRANLCYLEHYRQLRVISCSLDQNGATSGVTQLDETISKHVSKHCTLASIGLAYSEPSIIVATRLSSLPSQFSHEPQFSNIPVNSTDPTSSVNEWEIWGEEDVINLCELRLQFDGTPMWRPSSSDPSTTPLGLLALHTNALPPIQCSTHGIVNLTIVSSSQNISSVSAATVQDRTVFHMVVTCLDFGDYTSTPKSELIVHSFSRLGPKLDKSSDQIFWKVREEARRSFYPEVLCFSSPFFTENKDLLCHVGVVRTSGSIPKKGRARKVEIGYIKVLRLPDLSDDDSWQPSTIWSTTDRLGQELPLTIAVSQNGVLVNTVSAWLPHASVHSLPKRKSSKSDTSIPHHSLALTSAILLGKCTSDISHILSLPTVSMNDIVNILHRAVQLLERHDNGVPHRYTPNFMGFIIEVCRTRMQLHSLEDEKENLEQYSRTLFDVLSLKAFNEAFEECRDDDGNPDFESIWYLIGLSEFIVHFVENLVKECILWCNPGNRDAHSSLNAPSLLPLAHPYALENVCKAVNHVAKLRAYIGTLPAGGEKEGTAKSVLLDLVDCSGIDFAALDALLADYYNELAVVNADDCRLSLASCRPVTSMYPLLSKILRRIDGLKGLNKPMLFIKPMDLVDGVQQLSLAFEKKEIEMDAILKKPLAKQTPESVCVRCGGTSLLGVDLSDSKISIKWRMWEKTQMPRCVCYGFNVKANPVLQI